jgi:hypothetical protein
MYLPDELWDIIKEYQLNWKKTHKEKFINVKNELENIFGYYCCGKKAPWLSVHKITGYFHFCYLNKV